MNLHVHDLSQDLMRRMKERAAGQGKSLKGWVVEAVEAALGSNGTEVVQDRVDTGGKVEKLRGRRDL